MAQFVCSHARADSGVPGRVGEGRDLRQFGSENPDVLQGQDLFGRTPGGRVGMRPVELGQFQSKRATRFLPMTRETLPLRWHLVGLPVQVEPSSGRDPHRVAPYPGVPGPPVVMVHHQTGLDQFSILAEVGHAAHREHQTAVRGHLDRGAIWDREPRPLSRPSTRRVRETAWNHSVDGLRRVCRVETPRSDKRSGMVVWSARVVSGDGL